MAGLTKGASLVYPSKGFDAIKTLDAIKAEEGTSILGVPTMFVGMLEGMDNNPGKYNFTKLRKGVIAGSICPAPLLSRINKDMGVD